MARIFLSHAGADKPVVRRIADALRAAGHDPWLDEDAILVGESVPEAVGRGLSDADYVVVCLSKDAAARGWVEAERDATLMRQFQERKARLLPVRLEDVSPPHLIAHLAYVDLFPEDQAFQRGIARLLRSIAAHTAKLRDPGAVPGVAPGVPAKPAERSAAVAPLDVFISSAPNDEALLGELETHLAVLKRTGMVDVWHRGRLRPGQERQAVLSAHFDAARVVLLLVSPDFLASDDCIEREILRAVERHDSGQALVIPILVRACDWKGTPFGHLEPLPRGEKPVKNWPDRDQAWESITQEIRATVDRLTRR